LPSLALPAARYGVPPFPGDLPLLPPPPFLLERGEGTDALRHAVSPTRLLALTGPGGVGKTTLMLLTATAIQGAFPDGVWFVELAPLTQPDAPVRATARALGLAEEADRPLTQTLISHLRAKQVLLLLDNCEHLL